MVHRDIKPHNLMLSPQEQVKILDFGLARFLSEAAAPEGEGQGHAREASPAVKELTSYYRGMGTADYTAPEEAQNARQADIRADIYSLGCTLCHLLSGQVPFPSGTVQEKLHCHLERMPTPLAQLRPELPTRLVRVVERMMAKEPADRYPTPGEAAHALAPFAGSPRPRVLVVDDDPTILEAMKVVLEQEGYTVCCAGNGREALRGL